MVMKELKDYGYNFQIKILYILIVNPDFLKKINTIINKDYFNNVYMKWIVEIIIAYYKQYKTNPSLEFIATEIKKQENESFINNCKKIISDILECENSNDLKYVFDEFTNFCYKRNLENSLIKASELLRNDMYDNMKSTLIDAFSALIETDDGVMLESTSVSKESIEEYRDVIPLPWDSVNNITGGGIGKKELWVFIGNKGSGKSFATNNVGLHAAKLGYNVIHISLELYTNTVLNRYYSLLTNTPISQLSLNIDKLKFKLDKLPGKILVKHFPTKKASVDTIENYLMNQQSMNKIDLVIIDYPDLLTSGQSFKDDRSHLRYIFEYLRGVADINDVAIFAPTQTNRSGDNSEIVEGSHVSEAYDKLMIADFVMSWARTNTDKLNNVGRSLIIKNRFGPDGILLNGRFEGVVGRLELFSQNTKESIMIEEKYDNKKQNEQLAIKNSLQNFIKNN